MSRHMTASLAIPASVTEPNRRAVAYWLYCVAGLVALMILVGGITRLTDSGLSITSWKPIHGALPPLSDAEWMEEFEAYRQIPEYQRINKGMTLEEFKGIFWWEWIHRNLGRLIGLAFAIPFAVFWLRGQLERAWIPWLLGLFVLGGAQGGLGWFMVMSGLKDRVDVSQYRLAAHLTLAFVIYAALLWTAWAIAWRPAIVAAGKAHTRWVLTLIALIFAQIVLGGFVAGTDAGYTYNTWPLMDGAWLPPGLWAYTPWWLSPFESIVTIQWNHRIVAYAIVAMAAWVAWRINRDPALPTSLHAWAQILVAVTVAQVALGIATLLAVMPLWLAVLHQAGAIVLLTAALVLAFALRPSRL